jgi:DNA-binding NtrC family response regulator
LDEALANEKREHILRALAATDGNKELAANLLGISTRTLFRYRRNSGSTAQQAPGHSGTRPHAGPVHQSGATSSDQQ